MPHTLPANEKKPNRDSRLVQEIRATKEVSTDQEFYLGNSVLYPRLEGKFKRSGPCLFGVFRFFTKDDVFKVTLQGRTPRLLPAL